MDVLSVVIIISLIFCVISYFLGVYRGKAIIRYEQSKKVRCPACGGYNTKRCYPYYECQDCDCDGDFESVGWDEEEK